MKRSPQEDTSSRHFHIQPDKSAILERISLNAPSASLSRWENLISRSPIVPWKARLGVLHVTPEPPGHWFDKWSQLIPAGDVPARSSQTHKAPAVALMWPSCGPGASRTVTRGERPRAGTLVPPSAFGAFTLH
ncbi:unnamed protein product [Leuciscus chuanchicus]